ncbi:MAG: hypothetical protein KDC34_00225 [Saprospiraceae bacterium]|nr:hypothetical protein [Saprospiraceae bacterium]
MKKFLSLFALVAITLVFVTSGCKEDDTIDPINFPPDVVFLLEDPTDGSVYDYADYTTDDTTSFASIGIKADKGTGALKSLTITQDGGNVSVDRLIIRDLRTDTEITANNPLLILGDNVDGFEIEILLNLQDEFSAATYTFDVADENGLVGSSSITVTTFKPATPLDMSLSGVLFNAAGPAGTGGLNLIDGSSVGSTNSAAQIRDLGIDCAEPNASNWLAQFGTVNGADMKEVDATQLENFTFSGVDSKEVISEAYSKGVALSDGSTVNTTGCDAVPLSVTDVAAPTAGDVYVVESNGVYYMIEVESVNITTSSNGDSYTLNIKY